MVRTCPVCHEELANRAVQGHITRMANKGDVAHKAYREGIKVSELKAIPNADDLLDELTAKLERDSWSKVKITTGDSKHGMSQIEPVYNDSTSQMPESDAKLQGETAQSSIPKKQAVRKLKVTKVEPRKRHWYARSRLSRSSEDVKPKKSERDVESTLDLVTKIPVVTVILLLLYKAGTDLKFFYGWIDSPIAQLYIYCFTHLKDPGAMIVVAITAGLVAFILFFIHHVIWRLFFHDLQIRHYVTDKDNSIRAHPTSKEGRLFLTIGAGFWDRIYRRYTKKPRPDIITVYFKPKGFVNPFKVLASCDKGYLRDVDHSMFVTEGLFKRTLIATHKRRDTEDYAPVYWFENDSYKQFEFNSEWYEAVERHQIKESLHDVSQACGLDSSVQKTQMENNISYQPPSLLAEQKKVWKLKQQMMGIVRVEP